jgi:hypothetical protein
MGQKSKVYSLLVEKPEEKRLLGKPSHVWIDNIKMELLEIGLNVVDRIVLAQERYSWTALMNSAMNLWFP